MYGLYSSNIMINGNLIDIRSHVSRYEFLKFHVAFTSES